MLANNTRHLFACLISRDYVAKEGIVVFANHQRPHSPSYTLHSYPVRQVSHLKGFKRKVILCVSVCASFFCERLQLFAKDDTLARHHPHFRSSPPHPLLTSYSPSTYLVSGSVPCSPPNISHTCNIVIHPSVSQMSAQVFQTSYTKPKCWPTWYSRELYTSSTWHICRVIHSLIIQHNSKAIISPPYLNS